jgi:ubiquinone/menaquinone biosynthesis C-methylase UbiE
MSDQQIRFVDGDSYERAMGVWSRSAGEIFLDWLKPSAGLSWLDIGCGSGAFTQLITDRTAPSNVVGIDPSEGQLAFARKRPAASLAEFRPGDAMSLPFSDSSFDAAVMALVLFFVPVPSKGAAEMARVVRPGGLAAAYLWDMATEGFPFEPVYSVLRSMGLPPPLPPSVGVSDATALRKIWEDAGFFDIDTTRIKVSRTFGSFDEFWNVTALGSSSVRSQLERMSSDDTQKLKSAVMEKLLAASDGKITYSAVANAIRGRVPLP